MTSLARGASIAALLASASGCTLIFGIADGVLGDGGASDTGAGGSGAGPSGGGAAGGGGAGAGGGTGGDGGGGGAPVECPPSSNGNVVGCWFDDYIASTSETVRAPHELSNLSIEAYVPDGSATGFQDPIAATIVSDGVFTIEGIPDGQPFYLKVQDQSVAGATPLYYVTDRRDLDLGLVFVGRPDGKDVTQQKLVKLQMTNMTAWQRSDYLLVDSFAVNTEYLADGSTSSLPALGETTTDLQFNWQDSYSYGTGPKLVDGTKDDDVWVTHNKSATVNDEQNHPWTSKSIVDYFTSTDVDMPEDASTTVIGGAFTQGSPTSTQRFNFAMANLRSGISDGGRYWYEQADMGLLTNPAATYGNGIGPGLTSVIAETTANFTSPNENLVTLPALPYVNPYPADWPRIVAGTVLHPRFLRVPGAAKSRLRFNSIRIWDNANEDYTFTTVGHAPANVRVGGRPALDGGAVAFDGTAPVTVSWDPVPNRDVYVVSVRQAYIDVDKTAFLLVAIFRTTDTSIALPASLFSKDRFYQLEIGETTQAATYRTGHFNRSATPNSGGLIASGVFRFSSDCGNHAVDGSEQCDTGGMSATCDEDCSVPECGDSVVNTAAGEACDEGADSAHCDGDCTLPACGDDYYNPVANERCDDGNTVDGDGCSHDCRLEHCGDGSLDAWEECDDQNLTNGDGCDAFCRVEPGWLCDTAVSPSHCVPG